MLDHNQEPLPVDVTQHPRFVAGDSEYAQENIETLAAFSEGMQELMADNPEIAGATLFGSRLKGESTPDSDVDCTVLVDADQLEERGIHIEVGSNGRISWGGHAELREDYKAHIGDKLAAKTGKDPDVIKSGIYVMPISPRIITEQIDGHIGYLEKYDEYRQQTEKWFMDLDAPDSEQPKQPDYVFVQDGVPALFSPDLTGGLEKYRATVVEYLSQHGEYGEKVWRDILDSVAFGEAYQDLDDPQKYPTNLAEAKVWYS